MAHYGDHPKLSRSTEPVDTAVWHWFICNGPHGEGFNWHRECGKRDIELLAKFIETRESDSPGFQEKARLISLEALESDNPILVLTGIQVLTVVGNELDMHLLFPLLADADHRVTANARSALFERGIKQKHRSA